MMRALIAAFVALCIPELVSSKGAKLRPTEQQQQQGQQQQPRRLDVLVTNSDEYAETVVSVEAPPSKFAPGINPVEYTRITEALNRANELVELSKRLIQDERTIDKGREMMERAQRRFREVQDRIAKLSSSSADNEGGEGSLRKKFANHDIQAAREDEERALDVARQVVRHLVQSEQDVSRLLHHEENGQVSFPECMHLFTKVCTALINRYLRQNGLKSQISVEVRKKRTSTGTGFNKVVIITDPSGATVDTIPEYPFQWDGVDIGPWPACVGQTPEDCCLSIRNDITTMYRGEYIECQFFTPSFTLDNYSEWLPDGRTAVAPAVTYEAEENVVIMNESPDGRVHELPVLQTTA